MQEIPLEGGDPDDEDAEDHRLDGAQADVRPPHAVVHSLEIGPFRNTQEHDPGDIAAHDAKYVEDEGQRRQGDERGDELGCDEELVGINGHAFQRIDLLRVAHDADLRTDGRSGATDYHQRREHRPKFLSATAEPSSSSEPNFFRL